METWENQLTVTRLQQTAEVVCESKQLRTYYCLKVQTSGKELDYCDMLKTTWFKYSLLYIVHFTYTCSWYRWRSSGPACTHSICCFDNSNRYSSSTDNFDDLVCLRDTLQIGCIYIFFSVRENSDLYRFPATFLVFCKLIITPTKFVFFKRFE